MKWVLRRNCSLSPRQVLGVYLSLCAVSLLIAIPLWWHGAGVVLVFAGVELVVIAVALLVYARHAADRESITFDGARLCIEHHCGRRVERAEFGAAALRIAPPRGLGALVEVSGDGRSACVGRYTRPELRPSLARALRRALDAAACGRDSGNGEAGR